MKQQMEMIMKLKLKLKLIYCLIIILVSCSPSSKCGDKELALQNFYLNNKNLLDKLIFVDPINMNDHEAIIHYTYQKLDEELRRCE